MCIHGYLKSVELPDPEKLQLFEVLGRVASQG